MKPVNVEKEIEKIMYRTEQLKTELDRSRQELKGLETFVEGLAQEKVNKVLEMGVEFKILVAGLRSIGADATTIKIRSTMIPPRYIREDPLERKKEILALWGAIGYLEQLINAFHENFMALVDQLTAKNRSQ